MVAFRISEETYQKLHGVCESLGARSVSDLARSAVNRMVGFEEGGGDPLITHVEVLSETVGQLKATVAELESRLNAREGSEPRIPNAPDQRKRNQIEGGYWINESDKTTTTTR